MYTVDKFTVVYGDIKIIPFSNNPYKRLVDSLPDPDKRLKVKWKGKNRGKNNAAHWNKK